EPDGDRFLRALERAHRIHAALALSWRVSRDGEDRELYSEHGPQLRDQQDRAELIAAFEREPDILETLASFRVWSRDHDEAPDVSEPWIWISSVPSEVIYDVANDLPERTGEQAGETTRFARALAPILGRVVPAPHTVQAVFDRVEW